ncbi:MAG TPA: hypothetical protein PLS10_11175 [Chitinophagales bacterium]|nr:hypothetical protein [Chitinophagales bacterium]
MKIVTGIITIINLYFGSRNLLNVLHVLDDSKYSPVSTAIFAVLFLGMGIACFYFTFIKYQPKLSLLLGLGPWIVALVILFIIMISSDYH